MATRSVARADYLSEYETRTRRLGELRGEWAMVRAQEITTRRSAYQDREARGAGVTECSRVAEHATADLSASLVKISGAVDEIEARLRFLDAVLKYGTDSE